jgi:diguanylate cyclase (GGDEF)-like protein/PAS domain S-box-containing protein
MDSVSSVEQRRLKALLAYNILDTASDPAFDDLTSLAAFICETPIAIITLLDEKRQWFKSNLGLEIRETPRDIAFCSYTVADKALFVVENALEDPRFKENPLVTHDPFIRFYAGTPLITPEGLALGTLSVIDRVPRRLQRSQITALRALGRQVEHLLELRRNLTRLARIGAAQQEAEQALLQAKVELEIRVDERSARLQHEIQERVKERDASDALLNSLPGIFYVFDREGRFKRWNDNFVRITGYEPREMPQLRALDLLATDEDKAIAAERVQRVFDGRSEPVEADLLTRDGRRIPYLFNGVRVTVGDTVCLSGMGVDLTERKRSEASLRAAEERYRKLIEISPDAIFLTRGRRCIFANTAAMRLLGAESIEQVLQPPFISFIHPDSRHKVAERARMLDEGEHYVPRIEEKFIRLDGAVIDVDVQAASFVDGDQPTRLVVARDITQDKQYQHQLEQHANFDPLTRLANRNLFHDRLQQAMANTDRTGHATVIAFIDLDNFKLINDMLGHDVGDQLLVAIADCLRSCVRDQDTVARYGGDEFILVLNESGDEASLAAWISRLVHRLSRPFPIAGHQMFVTCSMGLSSYPRDGTDVQTLLKNADAAMYQAKAAGRNQFKFFTPSMNDRISERFTMEAKLRSALERGEFVLHYQPQIDLQSGVVNGTEALLRWNSPGEGLVSPLKFIPVAEESGLIVAIGEWVLGQACRDNKEMQESGLPPIAVSVNLSARQFFPYALVQAVQTALRDAALAPGLLKLEVTETTVMSRPDEAAEILRNLKALGVKLAIDDFGIGYSSLSYLQRFPMDQLKIDKSFIEHIADDPNDAAIAQAVITLGHSLNMQVVAEGVSDMRQVDFLQQYACDSVQGNYFCAPLPFDQLCKLLRTERGLAPPH